MFREFDGHDCPHDRPSLSSQQLFVEICFLESFLVARCAQFRARFLPLISTHYLIIFSPTFCDSNFSMFVAFRYPSRPNFNMCCLPDLASPTSCVRSSPIVNFVYFTSLSFRIFALSYTVIFVFNISRIISIVIARLQCAISDFYQIVSFLSRYFASSLIHYHSLPLVRLINTNCIVLGTPLLDFFKILFIITTQFASEVTVKLSLSRSFFQWYVHVICFDSLTHSPRLSAA